MAAVIPEAKSEVLEDDVQALLGGEPKTGEGEEFVDLNAVDPTVSAEPAASASAKGQQPPAATEPAPGGDEEGGLPENLRGKSRADIARMYTEAQSLIGRQGSELGELRKRADTAIQASLEALRRTQSPAAAPAAPAPAAPKLDDAEFFAKPQDAVAKLIENSPVIQEIRRTLGESAQREAISRAEAATARFNTAHPDAGDIMADPEFRQWVGSSNVRQQLLMRAHNHYDFDAGDHLFSTWKALHKPAAAPAAAAADDAAVRAAAQTLAARRKQAAQQATVPSNGNAAPSQGGSKRIYRRADVLKLMEDNPERYEQLAPELEAAYREGRVR